MVFLFGSLAYTWYDAGKKGGRQDLLSKPKHTSRIFLINLCATCQNSYNNVSICLNLFDLASGMKTSINFTLACCCTGNFYVIKIF